MMLYIAYYGTPGFRLAFPIKLPSRFHLMMKIIAMMSRGEA